MSPRAIDTIDRRIIEATQAGLPLVARPYDVVGEAVGMLGDGIVRRIGLVPNHYALGLTHNAMTVWDVDDARIGGLGAEVGARPFVTHCYERPRNLPLWPYNLFAMVHGTDAAEVETKIASIADILGGACRGHDVLFSTRILKKTGLRIAS
jgi:DNA-binding Lrp family transcriptional regulator